MRGILHIAYKLLVNDRAKYAALLVGITFAVFLMIEMTVAICRDFDPFLRDRHQHRRIDLGNGPRDPDRGQYHSPAGLRSGRGPKHSRREICRAALFRRRLAEAP